MSGNNANESGTQTAAEKASKKGCKGNENGQAYVFRPEKELIIESEKRRSRANTLVLLLSIIPSLVC